MESIIQGDVILKKTTELKGEKIGEGKHTLAYGEVTGHHHDIIGDVEIYGSNGAVLCQVNAEAQLMHQEHDTIQVPKGIYEVQIQREVDLLGEVRSVMD